jgi:hypothetical protein
MKRTELQRAIDHISAKVRKGLKHGFFDYRVTSEIVKGEKRRLLVTTGEKEKFVISKDEIKD